MKQDRIQLAAVLVGGLFVRLAFLGSKSIWLDEAFSVWMAQQPLERVWVNINDNHPPLYYLLLKLWMKLGDGEVIVRLPSVLISVITLVLMYRLANRLIGHKAAMLTAALLALSPLDFWYAQEARMYVFVAAAGLLIAIGFSIEGVRGAAIAACGLVLGLYFDYTIVPIWVILCAFWLARWWQEGRQVRRLTYWLAGSLAAWLLFIPLWSHLGWVLSRLSDIYVFAAAREAIGLPGFDLILPLTLLLLLGIVAAVGARWAPVFLSRPTFGRAVALLAVGGLILLTALTPIPRLYSVKRVVVTGWPFVILVVTWLVMRKLGGSRKIVAALLSVSLIATLISLLAVPKDDWRSAVAAINQEADSSDVVWLDPQHGILPYGYYEPTIEPEFSAAAVEQHPRSEVWHIAERQPNRPIPGSTTEEWLDANRRLLEVIPLYRLEVRHYSSAE